MSVERYRFDNFVLDPADRQLRRDGAPVELNARYLDALALLVREAGRLVPKDRFLDEVWRGVPVTDEALTQCIRTLRRQLGDEAARPRFIETVPKHGYRFVAPVESAGDTSGPGAKRAGSGTRIRDWRQLLLLTAAGTGGGAVGGLIGGLLYGFAATSQPVEAATGAASVVLVMTLLTLVAAVTGAAGVSLGIAATAFGSGRVGRWSIAGGALGGLIVGAFAELLGLDAFNLLVGRSPGDITGAGEGALLGVAVGLAAWLALKEARRPRLRIGLAAATVSGGAAGLVITLAGGRLMGGSLDLLAHRFPESRLRLDSIGALLGEREFGPVAQAVTGALEGALFAASIVTALVLGRKRQLGRENG